MNHTIMELMSHSQYYHKDTDADLDLATDTHTNTHRLFAGDVGAA